MYSMPSEERIALGNKAREYVLSEFAYQDTIDKWHDTMIDLLENWKYKNYVVETL